MNFLLDKGKYFKKRKEQKKRRERKKRKEIALVTINIFGTD